MESYNPATDSNIKCEEKVGFPRDKFGREYAPCAQEICGPGIDRSHDPLLQFFRFDHLPKHLQLVSKLFSDLANNIVTGLPQNSERTVALRKLLEAKDCAIRAVIHQ